MTEIYCHSKLSQTTTVILQNIKKSRSEEFHFGDLLMMLPYPCLAPHHPLSGTPSSHVWNPTCIWYTIICISYTTTYIWYTTTCLVPHHPCLVPHLCLVSHHITETPPLSGTPLCVWSPIPSPVWYPPQCPTATILPTVPYPLWPLLLLSGL